jgi:cell division protein FtsL
VSRRATLPAPRTRPTPPVRERRARPPLRVVPGGRARPSRAARSRRRVAFLFVFTVVAVLTAVAFHVVVAQMQLDLARVRRQTVAAERRYDAVRLEYAQLSSPERITQRAAELGLVVPARPPVAVVVEGRLPHPRSDGPAALRGFQEVKRHLDEGS